MIVRQSQFTYQVELSESDVVGFASRWPCYGDRLPLCFEYDSNNGDLIDLTGDTSDNDEGGVAALSNDACLAGALAIGLFEVVALRCDYGDVESIANLLAAQCSDGAGR